LFDPWIGRHYGKPENIFGGKRVLVVGESHHSAEHEICAVVPDMTRETMKLYGSGERARWMRTFDNMAWAVSGKSASDLEQDGQRGEFEVWNSMAFYNYIPMVLANYSRSQRPTAEQFKAGKEPFEKLLADLRPEVLLVWGFQLFPWLVKNHSPGYKGHPWDFTGEFVDLPTTPPTRAVRMLHPSTAFSPPSWHLVIQRAMQANQA
jgi:hypothetical protein